MTEAEIAKARALWHGYLDKLGTMADHLFKDVTPGDETTVAEGLRHLSRLTRIGLLGLEYGDPDFPVLARVVDEVTKFGCDNPDTIYQRAIISGAHEYRISGTRGTVDYLSFITTKPGDNGRMFRIGHLDTRQMKIDADGRFEIFVTHEPRGANWLALSTDTTAIVGRQTYLDRTTETPAQMRIERLGAHAVPPPLTLPRVTAGLDAAAGFAIYCATLFPKWTESYLGHVNQLPPADQEECQRAGGDPNIYFYRSVWRLAPDQALIVHIPRIPQCETWNLQVDNFWQESMDARYHHSDVNRFSAKRHADGGVTAIIAHTDPGHPNWLDTAGHVTGHFAMRWIGADEYIDPATRLVSFDEARALAGRGNFIK
jgi:hypothetical protein